MTCPNISPNEGFIDRLVRVLVGIIALLGSTYWLGGIAQIVSLVFGIAMLATGLFGFCGLYTVLKFTTCKDNTCKVNSKSTIVLVLLTIVTYAIGAYVSPIISKNKFLEDFGRMNGFYKQTLFLTGQNKRDESKSQYTLLVEELDLFVNKYSTYKPELIKQDKDFDKDLLNIKSLISKVEANIYKGDLSVAHLQLEEVRPVLQQILKRNGISPFAVALVDFHDIMEILIEGSEAKDTKKILDTYPQADEALKIVEREDNFEDIKTIRTKLEELKDLAINNKIEELASKAQELKTSFVKVYLIKG